MMNRILLVIITFLFVIGCSSERSIRPDTPENLAMLVKQTIDNQDISLLNEYFTDAKKGTISTEDFNQLKDISGSVGEYRTYSYLRINDEIILLEIVKDIESGMFRVQDIIQVPDESKGIFNRTETIK